MTEIDGISAGGMPTRVKCLHVLVAHALAAGPGVNPLGDEAVAAAGAVVDGRVLPHRRRDRATGPVAAIDCGTNAIRLLVADVDSDGTLHEHVRLMQIVRLGEGIDRTGEFAPEALSRTFAAIDEYAGVIREPARTRTRFVATSASRDASNREEFIAGVRRRLGVDPEVITGTEEAALSFAGAVRGLPPGRVSTARARGRHRRRIDRVRAGSRASRSPRRASTWAACA